MAIDKYGLSWNNHHPLLIVLILNLKNMRCLYENIAIGREEEFIDAYIKDGPAFIKEKYGLTALTWRKSFDYLVFENNLLFKCVNALPEFFLEIYIKHGIKHVREVLDVSAKKYDLVMEPVFDLLAISKEGLFAHILENREKYLELLKVEGGGAIRAELGLTKSKYTDVWTKVMEILFKSTCEDAFCSRNLEESLRAFALMIGGGRIHRKI